MKEHRSPDYQGLRKGRVSLENARYFITGCNKNRERILTKDLIPKYIFKSLQQCDASVELIALVVMLDHIHLVIRLKSGSLTTAIQSFKSRSAIAINKVIPRSGPLWQPVSFDHKFRADDDLAPILSYMWNNPEVPGQHFRCRKEEWLWFKSMVTLDVEYPEWLRKNPMG
jgi:REP element-mobilizing transposase RayT